MDTMIMILEDGVPAGTFTAAEIRQGNPDCPEVEAALRCIEAGAYQVEVNIGAGGVTTFLVDRTPQVVGPSDVVEVRASIVTPRRALASYRGTLAEVRAASDRDVAELELRKCKVGKVPSC
jgi:hypothetical protein